MEASSMIKGKNKDHDFSVDPDSTFHKHDNVSPTQTQEEASGIEMMKVVVPLPRVSSYSYTSLRDIMPLASPQHLNSNNKNSNCASWNEIPIKNPLLKHAALAYLQPMSTRSDEVGGKGFFRALKDNCFRWLYGGGNFNTLLDAFLGFFCGTRRGRRIINGSAEEEEEEDNVDRESEPARTDNSTTFWSFRFDH